MLTPKLTDETVAELSARATKMRTHAYCPYSKFRVGASLLSVDGRIFDGCNVENSSFGLSICAERVALFNAIAAGLTQFRAIALATGNGGYPCGACRQVLAEFSADLMIIVVGEESSTSIHSLQELIPNTFGPAQLSQRRERE